MLITVISLFVACIILSVGICFVNKNKFSYLFMFMFALIALVCLGVTCTAYNNSFSGYSILLIISVLPIFLTLFGRYEADFSLKKDIKNIEQETIQKTQKPEEIKFIKTCNLLKGLGFFVSTIALAFCGLYLGKETFFGMLFALAFGLSATFLEIVVKKEYKKHRSEFWGIFLDRIFYYLSVGLLISSILLVLLYSINLTSILFVLGSLMYIAYIVIELFAKNSKFNHLTYFVAMFLFFATVLF